MDSTSLPVSAPADQGVSAAGLGAFLDAVERTPDVELHGLVVLRHGHVVAQGWWAPYTEQQVHLVYSLSKSFTSTALGFAIDEGLVGLDDVVVDAFPEIDGVTDPRTRSLRVRHLAAMATGHTVDTWDRALALDPAEPVRGFLAQPPQREPGSVFAYNQSATYTVAAMIQRAAGQSLVDYLRPRLLDPLGIGQAAWQQHPTGRDVGFSGLHVTTGALARLGQLYLRDGRWGGRQLLPAGWVEQASARHVATDERTDPDWAQGYGYQFWRARHGYRGDGAFGQFVLVLPEVDAVVAITAATPAMQTVLDAVWEHLLPALTAGDGGGSGGGGDGGGDGDGGGGGGGHGAAGEGGDGSADAALARRLAGASLPPVDARPAPAGDAQVWDGATFAPRDGSGPLAHVGVDASEHGWSLTLGEPGWRFTAALGTDGWAASEPAAPDGGVVPVAVSGGWDDAGDLRFDVVFLQTPHRLAVTCARGGAAVEAAWVTAPLWDAPLSQLRAPAP